MSDRARWTSFALERILGDESSLALENLHSIIVAITDVNQFVLGQLDAVDIAKLLSQRCRRVIVTLGLVGRWLAVSAPHSLECPGVGIKHDDPVIAIAVGDEDFVGLRINGDVSDTGK